MRGIKVVPAATTSLALAGPFSTKASNTDAGNAPSTVATIGEARGARMASRDVGVHHFPKAGLRAAASLAVLLAAACAPAYLPPQEVQSSNPTVTYKYHSDQDLLTVNQSAANFCSQYQSTAQAATFANDPDGSKVVVYQCAHVLAPVVPQPSYNPNLTYSYRSDKELLDASQNAQAYCVSTGARQAVSSIVPNANGTRTVTFQCTS